MASGGCSAQSIAQGRPSLPSFFPFCLASSVASPSALRLDFGFSHLLAPQSLTNRDPLQGPQVPLWLCGGQGIGWRVTNPRMSERPDDIQNLVTALNRLSLALERSSSSSGPAAAGAPRATSEASFEVVSNGPGTPPEPTLEERREAVRFGDYNSFAELIPEVPAWILRECRSLHSDEATPEYRARRAWEAGYWAGLTLQGRVRSPKATTTLNLRPKVYIILRARGLAAPTRVHNSSDFYRITGRLEGSSTICHSFPSIAEATAYCEGAGFQLPPVHQWR